MAWQSNGHRGGALLIPRQDIELDSNLPTEARFWVPDEELLEELAESGESGIDYFRDVWPILEVSAHAAVQMLDLERSILRLIDAIVDNPADFDELCSAIEDANLEGVPAHVRPTEAFQRLEAAVDFEFPTFDCLELGVAGLAYALSAAGCYPAASCRGHGEHGWSTVPVVMFAADREHAMSLVPLVRDAGCGFGLDTARPNLLTIAAGSVEDLMTLSQLVLKSLD
jgi:hypothetical protein